MNADLVQTVETEANKIILKQMKEFVQRPISYEVHVDFDVVLDEHIPQVRDTTETDVHTFMPYFKDYAHIVHDQSQELLKYTFFPSVSSFAPYTKAAVVMAVAGEIGSFFMGIPPGIAGGLGAIAGPYAEAKTGFFQERGKRQRFRGGYQQFQFNCAIKVTRARAEHCNMAGDIHMINLPRYNYHEFANLL